MHEDTRDPAGPGVKAGAAAHAVPGTPTRGLAVERPVAVAEGMGGGGGEGRPLTVDEAVELVWPDDAT